MALPGRDKTFALEGCRDLLDKLDREIRRYEKARLDAAGRADHAYNAAVTAWHLSDWVFAEMSAELRAQHNFKNVRELQTWARDRCRAVHLCRQIATASKHWEVTQHADPAVAAAMTAKSMPPIHSENATMVIQMNTWNAFIIDRGKGIPADKVFREAHKFWSQVIFVEMGISRERPADHLWVE